MIDRTRPPVEQGVNALIDINREMSERGKDWNTFSNNLFTHFGRNSAARVALSELSEMEKKDVWAEKPVKSAGMSELRADQTYEQFYGTLDQVVRDLGLEPEVERLSDKINLDALELARMSSRKDMQGTAVLKEAREKRAAHVAELKKILMPVYLRLRACGYSHEDLGGSPKDINHGRTDQTN